MTFAKAKHTVASTPLLAAFRPILGLILLFSISACQIQSGDDVTTKMIHIEASASSAISDVTRPMPSIAFNDTLMNLGIIAEGNIEEVTFPFFNNGQAPLVLADVSTSCGCTIANDWPKTAIAPGQGAEIKVRFNSQGRTGENKKEIFVVANTTPSTTTLILTADVIGPDR